MLLTANRRLILTAIVLGFYSICSIGCAPLGLYSLGHSVLAHNHVLKPVLPDDEFDSSLADSMPMENGRQSAAGELHASGGNETCHE